MEPAEGTDAAPALAVEVIHCSGPGRCDLRSLSLPPGSTVADAVRASGLWSVPEAPDVGVHGRRVGTDRPLADGDRVELYRPLRMDPGDARRERVRAQRRARAAGRS